MKLIPLQNAPEAYAKIDDEDFEKVNAFFWYLNERGYAVKNPTYLTVHKRRNFMHHLVMKVSIGFEIDHINRDSLDNQKTNLRAVTPGTNCHNRSLPIPFTGYRGVKVMGKKFQVRINHRGTSHCLGTYRTAEQAAIVYDKAALKFYGPHAMTNKRLGLLKAGDSP